MALQGDTAAAEDASLRAQPQGVGSRQHEAKEEEGELPAGGVYLTAALYRPLVDLEQHGGARLVLPPLCDEETDGTAAGETRGV